MRAAVVGGSLGGLYAALLLRDLAIDVDIYERSPVELAQRGAGIGFLPESQRYLVERAGVALDEISVPTAHIRYCIATPMCCLKRRTRTILVFRTPSIAAC